MPRTYMCPFFQWEDRCKICCEMARLKTPDETAKKEYADRYCASLNGWRGCSVAKELRRYYDRLDREKRGGEISPIP